MMSRIEAKRMSGCAECGMVVEPNEYHPFNACLMFKVCHDGDQVRASLAAIQADRAKRITGPVLTEAEIFHCFDSSCAEIVINFDADELYPVGRAIEAAVLAKLNKEVE